MRSDRYKKSNLQSTMNHEDRHDFWAGNPQGEHTDAPTKAQTAGSFFRSLVIDIIIALILAGIVLFFIRPTIVKQTSMEDTFHENDYLIMYRQAYRKHGPERGDIVIFESDLVNICINVENYVITAFLLRKNMPDINDASVNALIS